MSRGGGQDSAERDAQARGAAAHDAQARGAAARDTLSREALTAAVAGVPSWYHVLELPHGVVTPGAFDMRPHLPRYHLPERLDGLAALDVGASNGYFAFEMERRGARVVAADLLRVQDHDLPAAWLEPQLRARGEAELAALDAAELRGFDIAREALGSSVKRVFARATELAAALAPEFDLALLSNVLLHLRDPVLALESCRDVLKPGGLLVVASPVDETSDASYALFLGNPERVEWWVPSPEALLRMARLAGFDDARIVDRFDLRRRGAAADGGTMAVLHARRPD